MTRVATAVVAVAGLAIATYLTVVHYTGATPLCAIAHGCTVVQRSSYAAVGGVPVAVAGVAGYLAILATLVHDGEAPRVAGAFVALAGLGFSLWLTYVEVGILHAICAWCVGSALCMVAVAALAVARLLEPAPETGGVRGG